MAGTQINLIPDLQSRIREHFDAEDPNEIVRQSQSLIKFPGSVIEASLIPSLSQSPALVHPQPRVLPLNAYLASALTGLEPTQKSLINHLSDMVNVVCRSVDINLYEPRKKTDPVHNAEVPNTDVFRIDKERVVASDLLIHLCHFPSAGSGEELSFAHDALAAHVESGELKVSFRVRNSGHQSGKDVSQVYVSPRAGGWEAPKRLGAFAKVELAPGASQEVTVTVDPRLLAVWNPDSGTFRVEAGVYQVALASSADDRRAQGVTVTLPARVLPAGRGVGAQ